MAATTMSSLTTSPEERRQAFGQALATARRSRNLSQGKLAELLETTQSTVSSWEVGAAEPDPQTVFTLEDALGCDHSYLAAHLGYCRCPNGNGAPAAVTPTPDAIAADPKLKAFNKKLMLALYREMTTGEDDDS